MELLFLQLQMCDINIVWSWWLGCIGGSEIRAADPYLNQLYMRDAIQEVLLKLNILLFAKLEDSQIKNRNRLTHSLLLYLAARLLMKSL